MHSLSTYLLANPIMPHLLDIHLGIYFGVYAQIFPDTLLTRPARGDSLEATCGTGKDLKVIECETRGENAQRNAPFAKKVMTLYSGVFRLKASLVRGPRTPWSSSCWQPKLMKIGGP